MRLIGQIENRTLAERAGLVLGAVGIAHRVEFDEDRTWTVWVMGDEDWEVARQLLAAFLASPEDPRFRSLPLPISKLAPAPGTGADESSGAGGAREGDTSAREREPLEEAPVGGGEVTLGLVIACVAVALATRFGAEHSLVSQLQISASSIGRAGTWASWFSEVRSGQIWRLVTPVLLHFSWAHFLFNLWTFWGLGLAIERRRGSWALLGLVVAFGVVSNVGQYVAGGPRFGGMSGVIYGLLGYVWMMGCYRPSAGLALQPQIVLLMLVWFVIGVYGAVPGSPVTRTLGVSMANTAHGMGLLAGVVWGRWVAWRRG